MKLIVISNPTFLPNESAIINNLFDEGMECLHLRKPGAEIGSMEKLLKDINPKYHSKMALHQHHVLANRFNINHLHFSGADRSNTKNGQLRSLAEQGYLLSTSIHQIGIATSLNHFDYCFFGPVFDSISKVGYLATIDSGFRISEKMPNLRIIALGGITSENINELAKMNFDGAAVLGFIWQKPSLALQHFNLLKTVNQRLL